MNSYILFAALLKTAAAAAHISVGSPAANQLPLVARIGSTYQWSLSPDTFVVLDGSSPTYSSSTLPAWLSFDPSTLTFRGTPQAEDKGTSSVTVTAADGKASATTTFSIPITSHAPPALREPFGPQFSPNPSLSSVFHLRNGSALDTGRPTLRIPPHWSFSVGFDGKMFNGTDDVFYGALQANSSQLPDWVTFSSSDITFNGYTPAAPVDAPPPVLSLALIASDIEGFSAQALPFDLVVAAHELSMSTSSLPTINVTAQLPFNVSLSSAADFAGVLLDDEAVLPANVSSVAVDVGNYSSWLTFDPSSRSLSGVPPAELAGKVTLPAVLTGAGSQTLRTMVSLEMTPPFFANDSLGSITVEAGQAVHFDLSSDFSAAQRTPDVDLSIAVNTSDAASADFLSFDSTAAVLSGTVPADFADPLILVTFVAYSRNTHSTSHAALTIAIPNAHPAPGGMAHHRPSAAGAAHRRKVVRALGIACGVVGALVVFALLLVFMRWFARVEDTADTGAASTRGYSVDEKRWYGLDGFEKVAGPPSPPVAPFAVRDASAQSAASRGVRKADFVARLRAGAQALSDSVRGAAGTPRRVRPVISRPTPVVLADVEAGLHVDGSPVRVDDASYSGSSSCDGRSDATVDERDLPRRRSDFMPPLPPPALARSASVASGSSAGSGSDASEEAVVTTAARARSVRSAGSASGRSFDGPAGRPRLVPFTSAARVPTLPEEEPVVLADALPAPPPTARLGRMSSQRAQVERPGSTDDWTLGVRYVNALGEDGERDRLSVVSLAGGGADRSARFSAGSYSLASSKYTSRAPRMPRVLARAGERFKIRMAVDAGSAVLVRSASGGELPEFVRSAIGAGTVEVWGTPAHEDVGELLVGAYDAESGECVGRVLLEVVSSS
jgi:axial budding pattern protein 2